MSGSSQTITLRDLAVLAFVVCVLAPAAALARPSREVGVQPHQVRQQPAPDRPGDHDLRQREQGAVPAHVLRSRRPNPSRRPSTPASTRPTRSRCPAAPGPTTCRRAFTCCCDRGTSRRRSSSARRPRRRTGSTRRWAARTSRSPTSRRGRRSRTAYANPYPSSTARSLGFKMNYTLTSDFAIAADMGPGPAAAQVPANAPRPRMITANTPEPRRRRAERALRRRPRRLDRHALRRLPAPGRRCAARQHLRLRRRQQRRPPPAPASAAPQDQYDSVILPSFDMGPQPGPIPAPGSRSSGVSLFPNFGSNAAAASPAAAASTAGPSSCSSPSSSSSSPPAACCCSSSSARSRPGRYPPPPGLA